MSVDDALAAPKSTVPWTGVRNYQARNFMRDEMRVGDGVLFYHSSCAEPGIVGIARVRPRPTPTRRSSTRSRRYYDPASKRRKSRAGCWWTCRSCARRAARPARNARRPGLADMLVLRKGNRLSITPVEAQHWQAILKLLEA